jgi:hypothetical protein
MVATALETHISVLFFSEDRVFKLLKPVDMGFLSHADRGRRLAAASAELELNRRMAPDVYLGLADVVEGGELTDRMVVMRRLPEERRMSALVGTVEFPGHVRAVAKAVAAFHAAEAPANRTDMATRDAVARNWRDNLDVVRRQVALEPTTVAEVTRLADEYLAHRDALFAARIAGGFVRDGHGDLLADDIFCLADGPRILDCLAFNEDLRIADVLCDIGFLAMDLHRLGSPADATDLLRWYQEFSNEHHPRSLAHHYVAYRASVRAKVACLRADQGEASELRSAAEYLALCHDQLRRGEVQLVLVGGGAGVGKSTLAHGLADRLGWCRLNTDELRKSMLGVGEAVRMTAEPGEGPYDDATRLAVYDELLRHAGHLLTHGESVILDASWNGTAERQRAAACSRAHGARLSAFDCQLDVATARERVARRLAQAWQPSDATPAVVDHLAATRDPWPEAVTVDMRADPADVVDRVAARIAPW